MVSEPESALLPGVFTHMRNLFFVTEATAVQQNDSDRTKQKKQIIKRRRKNNYLMCWM